MIKVEYNKKNIKISGHANYADFGKDIVCASVSSIVTCTINGILNINKDSIKYTDNKTLEIEVLTEDKIINILIDNMIELLKDLERQYPKNIKISKGE